MNKVIAGIAASSLLGLSLFAAGPAQADHLPPTMSCTQVLDTPAQAAVPAVPATPEIPAVPATYVLEFEFVHSNNPNHPNSPRWEPQGWNADGNPNSTGWESTGNSRPTDEILTPGRDAVPATPGSPAVPAKDATFKDVCVPQVTEHPVIPAEPEPTTPPTDAPWVHETATPSTPVKGVEAPAVTPTPVSVETTVAAAVPASSASPAVPDQLAYTGADKTSWAVFGGLMLLAGLLLVAGPKLIASRRH